MDDDLSKNLKGVPKEEYGEAHGAHLLEQYKLYVGMADKISERRQSANAFFLAVNTALISMLSIIRAKGGTSGSNLWYLFVSVAGMLLCYTWYRLVRTYKDLNSGKYRVVHAIEQYLPVRPYDAEWTALGEGKDENRYLPFTHIEVAVPWVFVVLYGTIFVLILIFGWTC